MRIAVMRSFSSNTVRKFCFPISYQSSPSIIRFFPPSVIRFSSCSPHTVSLRQRCKMQTRYCSSSSNSESTIKQGTNNLQVRIQKTPKPYFQNWKKWILGSILSILLPFWMRNLTKLFRIEGEVEKIVEEVETVAEFVEEGANAVEKLSSEVAEKIPEDGKLREAALFVEHISQEAEKDAQLTINFIHKVDKIKEEVEAVVEPIINQMKIETKEGDGK